MGAEGFRGLEFGRLGVEGSRGSGFRVSGLWFSGVEGFICLEGSGRILQADHTAMSC